MATGRVASIDFSIGLSALIVIVIEISSNGQFWSMPLGSYMHQLLDETFYASFLFLSGLRTTFISRSVLTEGPKVLNYFLARGFGVLILAVVFYFLADSTFLIHLSILLFMSIIFTQLNSSIIYFSAFVVFMLSITLPLSVSSSPTDVFEASSWWSDLLYLRADAFVPLSMYFLFGLVFGRSNFLNPNWSRFARIVSLLILVAAIFSHFATLDYFKSSYLIETNSSSRILPFSIFIYRPIFLLSIIPLCVLIYQLGAYLVVKLENSELLPSFLKIGQNHLSIITIGLFISSIFHFTGPHDDWYVRIAAWATMILIIAVCFIFKKQFKTGPVELLIQRFY